MEPRRDRRGRRRRGDARRAGASAGGSSSPSSSSRCSRWSPLFMLGGGGEKAAAPEGRGRPAAAGGHRDRPRPPGRRRRSSPRPARSPPGATCRSASPARAARSCACWSSPASGSAPARCWRSSTARSRPRRRRSWPPRSRSRTPICASPRTSSTAPSRWLPRGFVCQADLDRKSATRDAAAARVRVAQATARRDPRPDRPARRPRARPPAWCSSRSVEAGQVVGAGSRRPVPHRRRRRDGAARPAAADRSRPALAPACR